MEIIPAIDLKGGACVQLVGGDPHHEKIHIDDPLAQAQKFIDQGARWIHIVDLDRALGTGNNLQIIKKILEVPGARFQVGGGIRFTEDIDMLLECNAARVVVGTRAVTDDKWFAHVCERYGDRVVAAVDAKGDDILIKGWQESSGKKLHEWGAKAASQGIGGLLYTDVSREGRMGGVNAEGVATLVKRVKIPVVASGGVRHLDDLQTLWEAGAWGVVVGMAVYTGALDLKQAIAHFERKGSR
ncbi:MAG TPA: 1-(5-phosphoribosyl)-5-[(5-phosphoribosylamino)methylideneamino]imidazole-4-carboxamide isomerase [Candidatus Thermoplasmatota archaeon]|nr:1-(5-phosphoribosyl)-5-[(5-phosphoribosylamino)methylideneamino]imidazole-4-carboxamide isomerase [Candidatus Thermoplasmatota archaeon]